MMFCPKCSSILVPKKEGSKTISTCSCGYRSKDKGAGELKESVKDTTQKVEVIEDGDKYETLPEMKVECPKCGNLKAHFWEIQTRASDEPATKFMKCTKCKNVWRDYN
jgi:DNA-directed RNA polymerase subunit M